MKTFVIDIFIGENKDVTVQNEMIWLIHWFWGMDHTLLIITMTTIITIITIFAIDCYYDGNNDVINLHMLNKKI